MTNRLLLAALLVLPLSVHAEEAAYGKPMPAGEPLALSRVLAAGKPRETAKLAGRVTQVCQRQGCWFMIEDEGQAARVMIKDYAFVVPKNSQGRAVVYGRLFKQKLSLSAAQDFAAEADRAAPLSASDEWRIVASSVLLLDAPEAGA